MLSKAAAFCINNERSCKVSSLSSRDSIFTICWMTPWPNCSIIKYNKIIKLNRDNYSIIYLYLFKSILNLPGVKYGSFSNRVNTILILFIEASPDSELSVIDAKAGWRQSRKSFFISILYSCFNIIHNYKIQITKKR